MLLLFEPRAGFALFKVLDEGKPSKVEHLGKEFSTTDSARKVVKLKAFSKFENTSEALSAATSLIDSKPSKGLRKFLRTRCEGDILAVADSKLGSTIKERTQIECVHNNAVMELMRGVRSRLTELISGLAAQDLAPMSLGLSHGLSRYKLKFSRDKVDTMIVQAISLLDDLDKELNTYAMRVGEWYGWHFAELAKIIQDNILYAKSVKLMGNQTNAAKLDFSEKALISTLQEAMLVAKMTLPFKSPRSFSENSNGSALLFQNFVPLNKFHGFKRFPRIKPSAQSIIAPEITKDSTSAQTRVEILSEALPYIQKFRGKTIVVKYGGAAMKSEALQASVIADIVLLSCVGIRIVFVHGGGPEINQWLGKVGMKPNFLNGLRVTDASTMEIVSMVLIGKVNKNLVALINKAGGTAVGLSGIDGRLLTARPSPNASQLGFVGDIASIDPTTLRPLVDNNHIPVIASVAADATGQLYNINADTAAGELAAALSAEKLILLTDVAGILENRDDPGSLVKEIDIKGVKKMMEDGKIVGGMIPKVSCCVRSLAQGVRTASIIDGRLKHSLLLEILTGEGAGTMITG